MRRNRLLLAIAVMAAILASCASDGGSAPADGGSAPADGGGGQAEASALPEGYAAPPAGAKLAQVTLGMNDTQVRQVMGEPTNANAYMTGKAFIPFYYGPDTHRTDWMYRGTGRVVFSRNRYSGGLKVIRVLYNPNEP